MLELDRIDALVAARMAATRTPGVALAIVQDGAIVHARGYGVASAEEPGQPVTAETLFQTGSVTKPLSGTLVLRLVEQGVLDLDAPVVRWLPELRLSAPGAAERVTLRMLLSHTAGLPWDQISPTRLFGARDPGALARWVREELPDRPLVAPPGTLYSYSNPGISLAARVAEAATGRWYADLLHELVLAPLGMTRTTLDPTVAMTWPHAQSHERAARGVRVQHRAADNAACYPAAFAWSSASELARFALAHLGRGEPLLAPETLAAMHAQQAVVPGIPDGGYGLTFNVDRWRGTRRSLHFGGIQGFVTLLALLPEHGAAVALLANYPGFDPALEELADTILAGIADLPPAPEPAAVPPERARWPRLAGRYEHPGQPAAEIVIRGDTLVLRRDGSGVEVPLEAVAPDRYRGGGVSVAFAGDWLFIEPIALRRVVDAGSARR